MKLPNPFKTADGQIVIAQFPNWPLFLALGFYLLSQLSIPSLSVVGLWAYRITILYWAYLEITSGVNLWRRFLGLAVLFFIVASIIN